MEEFENLCIRALNGRLGDVGYQLLRIQMLGVKPPGTWAPAINAYQCGGAYVLCVALAGVHRSQITLQVEPRRVWIQGLRARPEPGPADGALQQVLALEIDQGRFQREVIFPRPVDPERARAEHKEGLLWIHLPYAQATLEDRKE